MRIRARAERARQSASKVAGSNPAIGIYEGLCARDPYDLVNLTLHCGTYIDDPDDPLQWLAFALPTDPEVNP